MSCTRNRNATHALSRNLYSDVAAREANLESMGVDALKAVTVDQCRSARGKMHVQIRTTLYICRTSSVYGGPRIHPQPLCAFEPRWSW